MLLHKNILNQFASDQDLFLAIKARQSRALAELYDRFGEPMYSLALYILKDVHAAEDLIQEIFLSQWNHCTYNPDRGSFKTFLLLLVRSRAIDYLRSRQSKHKVLARLGRDHEADVFTPDLADDAIDQETSHQVRTALQELPDTQRQALMLAYFQGLTQVEIATQMNVPVGTVKSWFRLGFEKLRRSLNCL